MTCVTRRSATCSGSSLPSGTLVVADRIVILKHGKLVADMRAADCPPAAQLWDYF